MITEVNLPYFSRGIRSTICLDDVDLAWRDERFERGENIVDPWRRAALDPHAFEEGPMVMISMYQWNCTVRRDDGLERMEDYLRSHGLTLGSRTLRHSSRTFWSFLLRMEEDLPSVCRALEKEQAQPWIELQPLQHQLLFPRSKPLLADRTRVMRWLADKPNEIRDLLVLKDVEFEVAPRWPQLIVRGPSLEICWVPSVIETSLDEEHLVIFVRKESTDGKPMPFSQSRDRHYCSFGKNGLDVGKEDLEHYEVWSASSGWRSVPRSSFPSGPPNGAAMLFRGRKMERRLDPSRLCIRIRKAQADLVTRLLERWGFTVDARFSHGPEWVFHLCFDAGFYRDIWEAKRALGCLDLGQPQHELMIDMDADRDRKQTDLR